MNIGPNITKDGLVLYYDAANIKSFRGEPTTNYITDPTTMIGWSSYQSGNDGVFTTEFGTIGYQIIHKPSWNGIYKHINVSGGTYTISAYFRYLGGTTANNGATVYTSGGGISDSAVGINKSLIGVWQRVSMTKTYSGSFGVYFISYGGNSNDDWSSWEVTMPQVEQKDYVTPFVDGTRGTNVATGGGFTDLSGYNNHGELVNGVSYNSDNCGSLVFDGVDDYVGLNNINVGNVFTFNCWVKPTTKTRQTIFCNGYPYSLNKGFLIECPGNSANGSFISLGADNKGAETYIGLTSNIWQMLTCRVNGSSELIKIYVNGSEVSAYKWQTNADIQLNYDYNNLLIGSRYGSDLSNSNISQVLLYNRALSQSEITHLYNQTKTRYL